MTREEFDNRVNEAVLAMDALEDRCRLKGINEANIEHITESIQERLQKEVVRFNMHEADMRINEAVLALDELEDGCRRSGMDEATISYMTRAVKDMIDENAVRVEKRYGPVREEFSDTVFAGAGSAGVTDVNRASLDDFPSLSGPDSLTYDKGQLYSQSVEMGKEPIAGYKESGLASIIDEQKLANYVMNKLTGGNYNSAPEPKPTLEAAADAFMNTLFR